MKHTLVVIVAFLLVPFILTGKRPTLLQGAFPMKHTFSISLIVFIAFATSLGWGLRAAAAEPPLIVEDGKPQAEIVIAEKPLRTVRLAAQELQDGIRKISGTRLPIVHQPTPGVTHLFVGRSVHTDRLKIKTDDLPHGAYRLVSGSNWLVLVGQDIEFQPIEPWARDHGDIVSGRPLREWRKLTGSPWGLPNQIIYKDRLVLPGTTGLPDAMRDGAKLPPLELWTQDERGSFNAVCGWLMRLGVRWYEPGELGEVYPSLPTIRLPRLDETVRPDFPLRRFNVRFAVHDLDTVMWAMRLGLRDPYGIESAHGMDTITDNSETFAEHPDWFAMVGGRRRYDPGANNHLCYSNEELIQETVRYVRALFDHCRMDTVSIMPPDGYTSICQCPLCRGKDSPERDQRGLASNYVWGFVNRVAKEVRKTHPDKKVLNCAYGIYTLPPTNIDKLEPNVVVSIVGGRRPMNNRPADQDECRRLREAWLQKTSQPLIIFENYPLTDRGWYLPAFTPHSLGASINACKGISQGEDIWLTMHPKFSKQPDLALNHFMVYFTLRMYWGGRHADVDAMFREYCRLFYGPAEREMHAFFTHCEAHWQAMEKDKALADTALSLFEKANAKADPTSIYGRRLALMDEFLKGLRSKSTQLGRKRGPVPVLRLVGPAKGNIVVDGKLDEEAWSNCPIAATGQLRELQTGRRPIFGTTVKAAWLGNDLYFAIRCDDRPKEKPNATATRNDDASLWYGDAIELLIETESHSHYQIAIGPNGFVSDLDRATTPDKWFSWNSKAEVATRIEDGNWTVEVRLPIRSDENDPLNQIVGRQPTRSLPWHINICRQRIRDDGSEYSAFSPTGTDGFHEVMKFATFYDGNFFQFDHGPRDDDFLESLRVIDELSRTGKRAEALAASIAAAERRCTDLQKAHALELAAGLARGEKKHELALQLISRIPIPAVQKAATMRHLLETGQAAEVVASFKDEDILKWPFWKRGDGFHARGHACVITKAGPLAEADLNAALDWLSDTVVRDHVQLLLGQNRETNLGDDAKAFTAYQAIVADRTSITGASEYAALLGIARIQTRRRQFDEALNTLQRAEPEKLQGYWRQNFQQAIDAVKKAQAEPRK